MVKKFAVLALLLLTGLPAAAAASPPLVLVTVELVGRGQDIVAERVDGSGRVSLTGGGGLAFAPAWSPDGTEVAFASNSETNGIGPGEIYVVNADGSGLRPITRGAPAGHARLQPTWSSDGTQIAYLVSNGLQTEDDDIWVSPAAGGAPRRLTTDGGPKRSLRWQPHGSLLLYDRGPGPWGLWTVDVATRDARRLDDARPFDGDYGGWSPDGSQIAYVDADGGLQLAAPDGSAKRALVTSPRAGGSLTWSPDGTRIAFAAWRFLPLAPTRFGPPQDEDVYVTDVATGRTQRLTGWFDEAVIALQNAFPVWWPDGSRLFFRSERFDATNVWQMNADGTCEQPVTGLGRVVGGPQWQPGGAAGGTVSCVDLRLHVTPVDLQVALGQEAQSTVTVENDGNLPATGVTVSGARLSRSALGTLAPGASTTIQGWLSSPTPGNFLVTVSVSANQADLTPADDHAVLGASVLPCTLVGTWGADVITGTPGNDRICGLPGPDRIDGGFGSDYLNGGSGSDTIIGGPGNDTIIGGGGADVIFARDGQRDWIDCGTEHDIAIVDRVDHTHGCDKVVRR